MKTVSLHFDVRYIIANVGKANQLEKCKQHMTEIKERQCPKRIIVNRENKYLFCRKTRILNLP